MKSRKTDLYTLDQNGTLTKKKKKVNWKMEKELKWQW